MTGPEAFLCLVSKRHKYVTLLVKSRAIDELPVFSFTVHAAEAKKLGEALLRACGMSADVSFDDKLVAQVEGVSLGGPPSRDDLYEFRQPK